MVLFLVNNYFFLAGCGAAGFCGAGAGFAAGFIGCPMVVLTSLAATIPYPLR